MGFVETTAVSRDVVMRNLKVFESYEQSLGVPQCCGWIHNFSNV